MYQQKNSIYDSGHATCAHTILNTFPHFKFIVKVYKNLLVITLYIRAIFISTTIAMHRKTCSRCILVRSSLATNHVVVVVVVVL